MNELFIQNPLGDSQLAESCGLGTLLPNQQAKYAQLQPNYPPVISPPVQTTVIDTSAVQELTNAINNMTIASQMQQQEIQKQHNENLMLRNNIQKMKSDKTYLRCFMDTVDGIAMCTEKDGFRNKTTVVGVISIISAQPYRVPYKDIYRELVLVRYTDSHRELREAIITTDEISSKNLIRKFHGFEYQCKSKSIANDYLANRINNVKSSYVITLHEYAGFYPYKEKADFNCNWNDTNPEIVGFYPPCVASRKLKRHQKDIVETQQNIQKYLHTSEKCLIFIFSVCGLLSTMLSEIGYSMEQYLVISAPDFNSARQAAMYLKIYDRKISPLSFDDTKKSVQDCFSTARDETVVISECADVDNQKRRSEIISLVSILEKQSQPHNTAIISTPAQFIIPAEKKICLSLSKNFYSDISQTEEHIMCTAFDEIIYHFINYVCSNYNDLKSQFKQHIQNFTNQSTEFLFPNIQSRTSWCILLSIFCILDNLYNLPTSLNEIANFIHGLFRKNEVKNGSNNNAVVNDFISVLNDIICDNQVNIIEYGKDMNFTPNTYQLIIDDDTLAMEESLIVDKILPKMTTTNSIHRILKSLDSDNLLYTSSKGDRESLRYKMTVHSNNRSLRLPFIVIEKDGILSSFAEIVCTSVKDAEWFSTSVNDNVIPIIADSMGRVAGQQFSLNSVNNLHLFATGISGKGKTHCLTERMCSLQRKGIRTIVFDINDSFTRESIIRNLSAGGNDEVSTLAENYVNEHITFHKIETDGIPVEPLKLNYNSYSTTAQNIISTIIKSHLGKLGCKQTAILEGKIRTFIESGDLSAVNMYHILTSYYGEKQESLQLQMSECLSGFIDFECDDRNWDNFFSDCKDIIIISMDASSKTGGYAMIDILMMSLFQHQHFNPEKPIAIFVDEIQNQNMRENSPIYQILRLGRKYRTGLNYATQFLSKVSKDSNAVLEMANLSVYFQPDNTSTASVAKNLGIPKKELICMNVGECYIKGDIFNYNSNHNIGAVLHGYTYRNFLPFSLD